MPLNSQNIMPQQGLATMDRMAQKPSYLSDLYAHREARKAAEAERMYKERVGKAQEMEALERKRAGEHERLQALEVEKILSTLPQIPPNMDPRSPEAVQIMKKRIYAGKNSGNPAVAKLMDMELQYLPILEKSSTPDEKTITGQKHVSDMAVAKAEIGYKNRMPAGSSSGKPKPQTPSQWLDEDKKMRQFTAEAVFETFANQGLEIDEDSGDYSNVNPASYEMMLADFRGRFEFRQKGIDPDAIPADLVPSTWESIGRDYMVLTRSTGDWYTPWSPDEKVFVPKDQYKALKALQPNATESDIANAYIKKLVMQNREGLE